MMSSMLISDTIDDEIWSYKGVVAEDAFIKDKAAFDSGCGALRPTTATNHIQQYQRSTPRAVTHVLVSWRWA